MKRQLGKRQVEFPSSFIAQIEAMEAPLMRIYEDSPDFQRMVAQFTKRKGVRYDETRGAYVLDLGKTAALVRKHEKTLDLLFHALPLKRVEKAFRKDPVFLESFIRGFAPSLIPKDQIPAAIEFIKKEIGIRKPLQIDSPKFFLLISLLFHFHSLQQSQLSEARLLGESAEIKALIGQLKEAPTYATHKPAKLRESPDRAARVIVQVESDSNLTIIQRQGNWLKVSLASGEEGWISRKNIRKEVN